LQVQRAKESRETWPRVFMSCQESGSHRRFQYGGRVKGTLAFVLERPLGLCVEDP
jgi:RNase P subunit RPR2